MRHAPAPLRFGVYTHPVHRPDHDPTIQLEQDVALAVHADALGLDQFWWGEHHSGGWRIVSDPMLMVARAATATHRIRLGAAVAVPLRHPASLVDSAIQLDHLTRGRLLLGLAADPVPGDVAAAGLTVPEAQLVVTECVDAVTRLLLGSEVSMTPRHAPWRLRGARTQLLPYAQALDVRVTSFGRAPGAELAGRFGHGFVTAGCSAPDRPGQENRMVTLWRRAQAAAAQHESAFSRDRWAAVNPIHVASSEAEARRQVRAGIRRWAEHSPQSLPAGLRPDADPDTLVDALHAGGHGVVGTPAMAVDHIERTLDLAGGVGTFLIELADWSSFDDTLASLDLFARAVIPRLTGAVNARSAAPQAQPETGRRGGRRAAASSRPTATVPTPARGVTRVHRAAPETRPPDAQPEPRPRGRHSLDPSPE